MEDGISADDVRVGDLSLSKGASMIYNYDFGDNWKFEVTLERIDAPDEELTHPQLLDEQGEAPKAVHLRLRRRR